MFRVQFLVLCLCVLPLVGVAQTYAVEWERNWGTEQDDRLFGIIPVPNKEQYILYGHSFGSNTLDRSTPKRGSTDIWLICIDEQGNKVWDKAYGSTSLDQIASMCLASDNTGFLLAGYTCGDNPTYEVSQSGKGGCDFWVVKIDFSGNKLWDRRYGGAGEEEGIRITPTLDNGYIIAGTTRSGAGADINSPNFNTAPNTHQLEFFDVWMVKIDASGNLIWERRLGGDQSDGVSSLAEHSVSITVDWKNNIWLGFASNSSESGTINSPSRGDFDWLLYKLDSEGNILNQWRYGGTRRDIYIYIYISNNRIILSGLSASGIGYEKSEFSRSFSNDIWILEIDSLGRKIKDKTLGGSSIEFPGRHGLKKVVENGYFLGGSSQSPVSFEKSDSCRGNYDYWLVLLDTSLKNILWQATLGGNQKDFCMGTYVISDGSLLVAGYSESGISGDKKTTNKGGEDYWVLKLKPNQPMAFSDLTFQSYVRDQEVHLSWASTLQKEGDYYVLERCDEKGQVTEVLTQTTTQTGTQHYYLDHTNRCGNRFYRLTLYSETGVSRVHRYEQARVSCSKEPLKIWNDGNYIYLSIPQEISSERMEVDLYDALGRKLRSDMISSSETNYRFETESLAAGVYLLKVNEQSLKFYLTK